MIGCLDLTDLEQAIADPRREIDGGEPRDHERDARHPEQGADVLAGLALREADRDEAGHGDKGASQHRERGGRVGERRGAELVVPFLELPVHHLDRDHGIVDKQPQRDDQGAKRDALQVDPHHRHDEERRGQHHGNGQGDDQAGPPAKRQERNHEHDADRLGQRLEKLVDRFADDLRLVRDAAELDADGQILLDALQSLLDGGTHLGDVGTGHHGGAKQHRLPALISGLCRRGVLEASPDVGDIAEPESLLPGAQTQLANVLNGSEPTLHVDAHRALARLDPSRGVHRILAGERRLDVERGEAALGQCGGRHFDENALLLQP